MTLLLHLLPVWTACVGILIGLMVGSLLGADACNRAFERGLLVGRTEQAIEQVDREAEKADRSTDSTRINPLRNLPSLTPGSVERDMANVPPSVKVP